MILIISDRSDLQVHWVTYYLKQWDVPYQQFNVAEYPLEVKQTSTWTNGNHQNHLRLPSGREIDCSSVGAVWYRKPDLPQLPGSLLATEKDYAFNEARQGLHGIYNSLCDCFWISDLHNLTRASNKPLQLSCAARLGFSIPETIITNDPAEAWSFYQHNRGKIIYKTLSTGILGSRGELWEQPTIHGEIYTTPLEGYQAGDFAEVANCPCLFQRYVEKKFEIRVTVVGKQVFAAEIHSQESQETLYDWRRSKSSAVTHGIHQLPEAMSAKCILLVEQLGLQYGAIDMIVSPDDEYIFLEINPNGQYGWVEQATGLGISEAIAQSLLTGARASKQFAQKRVS